MVHKYKPEVDYCRLVQYRRGLFHSSHEFEKSDTDADEIARAGHLTARRRMACSIISSCPASHALRGQMVLHINLKVDLGTWLSTAGAFPLLSGTC